MGLFGSTKIYVDSVVYNMAGEAKDRPDFLKTVIASSVLGTRNGKTISRAKLISDSYLSGRGMKIRNFYRWAVDNYDKIGVPEGTLVSSIDIPPDNLSLYIPLAPSEAGGSVKVHSAQIDQAVPSVWAEQWMLKNHPSLIDTDWTSDYDAETNEVIVFFADNNEARFTPEGFDEEKTYIYATYSVTLPGGAVQPAQVYIYAVGSGVEDLDALARTYVTEPSFYAGYLPFIPLRVNNKMITELGRPDIVELAGKACRRALNTKVEDLIDKLADNENLGDIDYAYVMFGANLNTKDKATRKYIYNFFYNAMQNQRRSWGGGSVGRVTLNGAYADFEQNQDAASAAADLWLDWNAAQNDPENPLYGTAEPPFENAWGAPLSGVRIKSKPRNSAIGFVDMNVDIRISWRGINETRGNGLLKRQTKDGLIDAEPGAIWFTTRDVNDVERKVPTTLFGKVLYSMLDIGELTLNWQISDRRWRKMSVVGLAHRNFIYKGKSVDILPKDALLDTDDSGFIIPIQMELLNSMGLVDATQVAGECVNLVLNCYKVVRKKWYQTGIFAIVTVIVIVVAAVLINPGLFAAAPGILGTNAAVGIALGLTGVAAIVAGAVANALVAVIISQILLAGSVALFGDGIGQIIGTILSMATTMGISAGVNGQSIGQIFNSMTFADKLLMGTQAVSSVFAGVATIKIQDLASDTEALQKAQEDAMRQIQQSYESVVGYGRGNIDPLGLQVPPGLLIEPPETFLSRTLLSGSDIADLSLGLINNFADIGLSTQLPILSN